MSRRDSHASSRGNKYASSGYDAKTTKGSVEWMEEEFAKSGLPDSYYEEWMMNPYWHTYQQYNSDNGLLSGISESLTGSSSSVRNARQAEADARAYWAKMLDSYRQQQYDLPVNQVARDRAAGLNPNLLGIDSTGNSAGVDIPDDVTNMETPAADLAAISGIVDPILSVAQTIYSLKNMSLQNQILRKKAKSLGVQTQQDIMDLAFDLADATPTADSFVKYKENPDTFLQASYVTDDSLAVNAGLSDPADVRSFNNFYNTRLNSIYTSSNSYDAWLNIKSNRYNERSLDVRLDRDLPEAEANLVADKLEIEAKYTKWLADLLDDAKFEKIWKEKITEEMRADVAEAMLSSVQDEGQRVAYEQFFAEGGSNLLTREMKQNLRTQIQIELTAKKEAELAAKDADSMMAFLKGLRPSDVSSNREARRRKRFARRQSRKRYGESGYYRYWHNSVSSWLDADNWID